MLCTNPRPGSDRISCRRECVGVWECRGGFAKEVHMVHILQRTTGSTGECFYPKLTWSSPVHVSVQGAHLFSFSALAA